MVEKFNDPTKSSRGTLRWNHPSRNGSPGRSLPFKVYGSAFFRWRRKSWKSVDIELPGNHESINQRGKKSNLGNTFGPHRWALSKTLTFLHWVIAKSKIIRGFGRWIGWILHSLRIHPRWNCSLTTVAKITQEQIVLATAGDESRVLQLLRVVYDDRTGYSVRLLGSRVYVFL